MNIHPIRTENDYKAALRDLSVYFNNEPEPGTDDGYRFEILATLVEAYEAKNFPIEAPDPIEASGEYPVADGNALQPAEECTRAHRLPNPT